jgi:uncharacterized protein with GYD domain
VKLTKKQLTKLIEEEFEKIKEAPRPDVQRVGKLLDRTKVEDLIRKTIGDKIELFQLISGILDLVPEIEAGDKVKALRLALADLIRTKPEPPPEEPSQEMPPAPPTLP